MSPSCAVDATRRPARSKTLPRTRPRAPCAEGLSITCSSHSSARKGAWNHTLWSRDVISEMACVSDPSGSSAG